jgi:hypothetical protein
LVNINTILLKLSTKDIDDGELNSGRVYLGICGREFYIDSVEEGHTDNFERAAVWTYVLGDFPTTIQPNNPPDKMTVHNYGGAGNNQPKSHYALDTDMLVGPQADTYRFPVYIRMDSDDDHWALAGAECLINPADPASSLFYATIFSQDDYILLGPSTGEICYLTQRKLAQP